MRIRKGIALYDRLLEVANTTPTGANVAKPIRKHLQPDNDGDEQTSSKIKDRKSQSKDATAKRPRNRASYHSGGPHEGSPEIDTDGYARKYRPGGLIIDNDGKRSRKSKLERSERKPRAKGGGNVCPRRSSSSSIVVQILALDHRRADAKVTMIGEVANLVATRILHKHLDVAS